MLFSHRSSMKCVGRKARIRLLILVLISAAALVVVYQAFRTDRGDANEVDNASSILGGGGGYGPSSPLLKYSPERKAEDSPREAGGRSAAFKWPWSSAKFSREVCSAVKPKEGIKMYTPDVYSDFDFKSYSKSYWNLTFEQRYLERRQHWDKLPLKVIVIPHSHNDPGWLKTFEGYFLGSTAHILNNMVEFLNKKRDFKFIWSEICFLARWWRSLQNRPHLRETVRSLVYRGQLEIVTGGWVMTDEAAVHYYSMVDQLIEGHQWLRSNLKIVPRNGWSIDPFGHGATVPYLLQISGIYNTVIQRTHYAWKQFLAARQQLEFLWKQPFRISSVNDTGVLCHMAPFELYSIKHTCGPDTEVCLKFDFRRLAGEYTESRATQVSDFNVNSLSEALIGQYGRIGSLFPHNVALVPLGDDFRYDHDIEWEQQYTNYKKLFDHINRRKELHAEVKFGTLNDYFTEVHQRMAVLEKEEFTTVAGDFHPYGDVYAEGVPSYWTGYFTTRPFMKHLSRELEHWLRTAEILYSLARFKLSQSNLKQLKARMDADYVYLVQVRDALGLFQHHDAITGTSKEEVMKDYGMRMYHGLKEAMGVISHSAQFLMLLEKPVFQNDFRAPHPLTSYLTPDIQRSSYEVLAEKIPSNIPPLEGRKVVLFNSHAHAREEVIRVHIKDSNIKVTGPSGKKVPYQISPVWINSSQISSSVFEVVFLAHLPALSLVTYTILLADEKDAQPPEMKTVISSFITDAWEQGQNHGAFMFERPTMEDFELRSPHVTATFSHKTGYLLTLKLTKGGARSKVNTAFLAYRSMDFHSGAYLFQPDTSEPFQNVTGRFPIIRVVRGPIVSEVTVIYPENIVHRSRVYHLDGPLGGGLEMETTFDLSTRLDTNIELFLKFDTDIESDRTFFTDSAGFQMMKRVTDPNLPIQANYYPITAAAYLEDRRTRLTLLVSHAHGCASIQPGTLEVMLDRKLRYDDSRGLGEGVMDQKNTVSKFWLVLEERDRSVENELPNLSLLSHTLSTHLNYPPVVLITDGRQDRPLHPLVSFLNSSYPCDTFLLNLKTIPLEDDFDSPSHSSLLLLHRKGTACKVKSLVSELCSSGSKISSFHHLKVQSVHRTLLTGTKNLAPISSLEEIKISPMEIITHNITFAP